MTHTEILHKHLQARTFDFPHAHKSQANKTRCTVYTGDMHTLPLSFFIRFLHSSSSVHRRVFGLLRSPLTGVWHPLCVCGWMFSVWERQHVRGGVHEKGCVRAMWVFGWGHTSVKGFWRFCASALVRVYIRVCEYVPLKPTQRHVLWNGQRRLDKQPQTWPECCLVSSLSLFRKRGKRKTNRCR